MVWENELPLLVVFFLLKNSSSTSIFSAGCWLQLSSSFKPSNWFSEPRVPISSESSNKLLTPPITEKLQFDSSWWPPFCWDNWDRNFPDTDVILGFPKSADKSNCVTWAFFNGLLAADDSLSDELSSPFLSSLSYPKKKIQIQEIKF